jgi:hypothetical protein
MINYYKIHKNFNQTNLFTYFIKILNLIHEYDHWFSDFLNAISYFFDEFSQLLLTYGMRDRVNIIPFRHPKMNCRLGCPVHAENDAFPEIIRFLAMLTIYVCTRFIDCVRKKRNLMHCGLILIHHNWIILSHFPASF